MSAQCFPVQHLNYLLLIVILSLIGRIPVFVNGQNAPMEEEVPNEIAWYDNLPAVAMDYKVHSHHYIQIKRSIVVMIYCSSNIE